MNNQNVIIKVTEYATLAEAVAASKMDLSYNEASANQKIREIQRYKESKRFFLTESNEVYYTFASDVVLLNKFVPFSSCLDQVPFKIVNIGENEFVVCQSSFPRNMRKHLARMLKDSPNLALSTNF